MVIIAPLDYERYAVFVSPLVVPEANPVGARIPPRQTEPTDPVSAEPDRAGRSAGDQVKASDSRTVEISPFTLDRDPEHPSNGPHPTAVSRLDQVPIQILDSPPDTSELMPRKVTELYESRYKTQSVTVRTSS